MATTKKPRRGARILAPPVRDPRALSRHAPSVRLDAAAAPEGDAPVWLHVATEGTWEGHPSGPFTFDRTVFTTLIDNLHSHPWFAAGPDGKGCADVVQWDFHHASEASAVEGDIPVVGAPAQAWVLDLEVRDGADGKAQLWALTRLLPLARDYVRQGKYRSASVAIWFDAIDPVTGEEHGPELTSIAFTNHPFIQGMTPLAASRVRASIMSDPYAAFIKTPQDVIGPLANMLEVPDETPAEGILPAVQAKIAQIKSWLAPGATVPAGVDPLYAASCLRDFLRLPVMTAPLEVIDELEELFATLTGAQPPSEPPGEMGEPTQSTLEWIGPGRYILTTVTDTSSIADEFRKISETAAARELKVRVVNPDCGCAKNLDRTSALSADDQALFDKLTADEVAQLAKYPWDECIADQKKRGHSAESAAKICAYIKNKNASAVGRPTTLENNMDPKDPKIELDFYRALAEQRKLSLIDPRAAVLKCMDDGMAAQGDVGALLSALGVKTVAEAAPRIAALLKAEGELATMKPEYDALKAKDAQSAAMAQETEVAAAMAMHNMPPNAKSAMLLQRRTDPDGFKRDYPMPEAGSKGLGEPLFTHTTNPILQHVSQLLQAGKAVAVAADSPLDALQIGPDGRLLQKAKPQLPAPLGGKRLDLSAYPGRNTLEQAMAYVRGQQGNQSISFEDAHERASAILRAAAAN